jgi:hypothetical protein
MNKHLAILKRFSRLGTHHVKCRVMTTRLFIAGDCLPDLAAPSDLSIQVLRSPADVLVDISCLGSEDIISRFARGDCCYLGYVSGRVAHFSWAQQSGRHKILSAGREVQVLNGHLWIYHCFTAVWARGKKIYPAVLRHIVQSSSAYERIWIYTTDDNYASKRGISQAGFLQQARFRAFAVGALTTPLSLRRSLVKVIAGPTQKP